MQAVKKSDGVVLVEFALLLPVLLLILFGILSFGLAFNYWIDETHLTREAARYAAVDYNPGPEATLQSSILSQSDTAQLAAGAKVCISYPPNADGSGSVGTVGDPVEATMTYVHTFIPFLNLGSVTINASATMRLEAPASDVSGGCTT